MSLAQGHRANHRLAELSREPPQRQAASSLRSDPKGKQTAKSASAPSRKAAASDSDSEAGGSVCLSAFWGWGLRFSDVKKVPRRLPAKLKIWHF